MTAGLGCGELDRRSYFGISLFLREEGGFTTVSVAVSLLVSLCLVFGAAAAGWVMARSNEAQVVADATAMAGSNVVAAYATVAQTLDACVLSMGITGVIVCGAGLVLSAVPGLSTAGLEVSEKGREILDSRREFARTAGEGLERLEGTLPLLIAANSAQCVAANATEHEISYAGCAVPFPQESQSDFKLDADDVDASELEKASDRMREASDEAKKAKDVVDELVLEGWLADCADEPYCMRQRAQTLAGLGENENPNYPTPESWNFGVPLLRARNYYSARLASEQPSASGVEALTDSCARKAFYGYALERVRSGHYTEHGDGTVDLDLPRLPKNTAEIRATTLYTDECWPCTNEKEGRVLHSSLLCPGAKGGSAGVASLRDEESGAVGHCDVCRMDVGDLGKAPAASTSIENGFEHHWLRVCEAAEKYRGKRNELAKAEKKMRDIAEEGAGAFDRAIDALSVTRPRLCPPGAWGCVSVVVRASGKTTPAQLAGALVTGSELPAGAATSAAVLAPDEATANNNILSRFFDGLGANGGIAGLPGMICDLWGRALVAYGSAYEEVSSAARDLFDSLDGVLGGSTASRLRERLNELVEKGGFTPSDLSLRKPILINTRHVLRKAGYDDALKVREFVEAMPSSGNPTQMAEALGQKTKSELAGRLEGQKLTLAELPIPGTNVSIPLTVDLGKLVGAL